MRGRTRFCLIVVGCLLVLAVTVSLICVQTPRSRSRRETNHVEARPETGAAPTVIATDDWYASFGTNVNQLVQGRTPLIWAAKYNDLGKVKRLIEEKGADVNLPDFEGQTPLMWAAMAHFGDEATNIVKFLLEHGAKVNARDKMGNGALDMAGSKQIAKLLEQAGATENIFGPVARGDLEAVKHAIAQGADLNATNVIHGRTPLMVALTDGHREIAVLLVEKGANVNARDKGGMTPLIYAAYGKDANTNVVALMIQKGADVNAKDNEGKTPLQWAKYFSAAGIEKQLRDAGAKD